MALPQVRTTFPRPRPKAPAHEVREWLLVVVCRRRRWVLVSTAWAASVCDMLVRPGVDVLRAGPVRWTVTCWSICGVLVRSGGWSVAGLVGRVTAGCACTGRLNGDQFGCRLLGRSDRAVAGWWGAGPPVTPTPPERRLRLPAPEVRGRGWVGLARRARCARCVTVTQERSGPRLGVAGRARGVRREPPGRRCGRSGTVSVPSMRSDGDAV